MSTMFGSARQNGIVVDDLDQALDYWTRVMRVGPFFRINHVRLDDYRYGAERSPVDLSVAVGNFGDLQLELIFQHNDAPSSYREFLRARGPGLHHISVWSTDYDDKVAAALAHGMQLDSQGQFPGGIRFAYFSAKPPGTPLLEITHLSQAAEGLFGMVREAARHWDGSDPVRTIDQAHLFA